MEDNWEMPETIGVKIGLMMRFFMKRVFILVILALMVTACFGDYERNEEVKVGEPIPENRIKKIEDSGVGAIIEIDGHEYFSRYHGGTIHLESCQCYNEQKPTEE